MSSSVDDNTGLEWAINEVVDAVMASDTEGKTTKEALGKICGIYNNLSSNAKEEILRRNQKKERRKMSSKERHKKRESSRTCSQCGENLQEGDTNVCGNCIAAIIGLSVKKEEVKALKVTQKYFDAIKSGKKEVDIRYKNPKNIEKGDRLAFVCGEQGIIVEVLLVVASYSFISLTSIFRDFLGDDCWETTEDLEAFYPNAPKVSSNNDKYAIIFRKERQKWLKKKSFFTRRESKDEHGKKARPRPNKDSCLERYSVYLWSLLARGCKMATLAINHSQEGGEK